MMLRNSSPPIVPRRREAPITATLRGSKNGPQGRRHRDVIALGEALLEALGARDRERDLHLASRQLAGQLEAERLEDAEHPPVVRQHLCDEALDPVPGGALGELLDEARADAAALVRVGDGEGSLGDARVAQTRVVREGDHPLGAVLDERAEQRAPLGPVRVEHLLDDLWPERGEPVEAHVEALLGQSAEEVEDRIGVVPHGRAKAKGASVPQDHVDDIHGRRILADRRLRRHHPPSRRLSAISSSVIVPPRSSVPRACLSRPPAASVPVHIRGAGRYGPATGGGTIRSFHRLRSV